MHKLELSSAGILISRENQIESMPLPSTCMLSARLCFPVSWQVHAYLMRESSGEVEDSKCTKSVQRVEQKALLMCGPSNAYC